jgi:hypothetical protein
MFKDLIKSGKHVNMGFPIAEVNHNGTTLLKRERESGGEFLCLSIQALSLTYSKLRNCGFVRTSTSLRNPRVSILQL